MLPRSPGESVSRGRSAGTGHAHRARGVDSALVDLDAAAAAPHLRKRANRQYFPCTRRVLQSARHDERVGQAVNGKKVGAPSTAAGSSRLSTSTASRNHITRAGKPAAGKCSRWGAPRVVRSRPLQSSPAARQRRSASRQPAQEKRKCGLSRLLRDLEVAEAKIKPTLKIGRQLQYLKCRVAIHAAVAPWVC